MQLLLRLYECVMNNISNKVDHSINFIYETNLKIQLIFIRQSSSMLITSVILVM